MGVCGLWPVAEPSQFKQKRAPAPENKYFPGILRLFAIITTNFWSSGAMLSQAVNLSDVSFIVSITDLACVEAVHRDGAARQVSVQHLSSQLRNLRGECDCQINLP